MVIIGCDISLEHAGFSFLNENGEQTDYTYFTNIISEGKADSEHSVFLDFKRREEEDLECYQTRRLVYVTDQFNQFVKKYQFVKGTYFCIESYAFGAATNSICQTSELTGCIKREILKSGGLLRTYDPVSVKYFTVGKGNAKKDEIIEASKKTGWTCNAPVKDENKKKIRVDATGPMTDVADAYSLARMLWMELQLREGKIGFDQLTEKQILSFNRVTKAHPVNVLARPFMEI